ncbi:MAG: alpha/beta hydrolase [Pseudomonadota bacterium]
MPPSNLTSQTFACNGQTIHAKVGGPDDAPVMLFLHGFPEYWVAWEAVARQFADRYRVVLPDQRGFNLSSKPTDRGAYNTKHLVADMADLVEQVAPDQRFILCGHDWGASVAYAFAMRDPERVEKLIIANGVHPICFQKALYEDPAQTDASQYMNVLRTEGSEGRLSRDTYQPLMNMFEKFSAAPWLDGGVGDSTRSAYLEAWSQPGALSAMLNWYRGSPMVVPDSGTPPTPFPITHAMREKYALTMPHLLLWGMDDTALLPSARADLHQFCTDLTVIEFENASHWILHEKPDKVANEITRFLDGTA